MSKAVIDKEGFRENVGIIIVNQQRQVFWARRIGVVDAWQFPQGGVNDDESLEQAMFRELREETGLTPQDVSIIACTEGWLRYRLPKRLIRYHSKPLCIGQKQKWYLLKLNSRDDSICLDDTPKPEFDLWKWVDYWHPVSQVVSFKRKVYRLALQELEEHIE